MTAIQSVIIDSREPEWVQELSFRSVPTIVTALEYGDLHIATNDGAILVIERKTPADLLNSLADERLYPQLTRMMNARMDEQIIGQHMTWPYLLITGEIRVNQEGKAIIDSRGPTGWSWTAVQGALLTVQEMGVGVVFCNGDSDLEAAVIRLAERSRKPLTLLPARPPEIAGPGLVFMASLPGIGIERAQKLLQWTNNIPAHALSALTDLTVPCPVVGEITRKKIRAMLGLMNHQSVELYFNDNGEQILDVMEQGD